MIILLPLPQRCQAAEEDDELEGASGERGQENGWVQKYEAASKVVMDTGLKWLLEDASGEGDRRKETAVSKF